MPDVKLDKFRFGIYAEGKLLSSLWSAKCHKDDIYLGVRNLMGMLKVSLHGGSGSTYCQVAFNKEYIDWARDNKFEKPEDRVIVSWERPKTPKKGAVHVASICFPTEWLKDKTPLPKLKETPIVFSPAPPGKAIELGFFYSLVKPETLPFTLKDPNSLVIYWPLTNGEFVSIFSRIIPFDSTKTPNFKGKKNSGIFFVKDMERIVKEGSTLSMVLINDPNEGKPLILTQLSGVKVKEKPPLEKGPSK